MHHFILLLCIDIAWGIVFYAISPSFDRTLLEIAILLMPAIVIIIGLLPKMFLIEWIKKISRSNQPSAQSGIRLIAILGPLFLLGILVAAAIDTLTVPQRITSEYLLARERWNLVFLGIGCGIQVLFLITSLRTLISKS